MSSCGNLVALIESSSGGIRLGLARTDPPVTHTSNLLEAVLTEPGKSGDRNPGRHTDAQSHY